MNRRLNWIDIAKAIAIILMVFGHTSIPSFVSDFIYAFHMPLFFIASGWTTSWNKYSYGDFVKKRTRHLLFPFIIYSGIVLLVHIHYRWMTMDEWLINGWGNGYALWFIPVLYIATIIVKTLYTFRESVGSRLFWIVVVLILCLGVDLHYYRIRLPWNLSSIPYAVFMIAAGSELSKLEFIFIRWNKAIVTYSTFFMVLIISHFWRLDMCFNNIAPLLPLTIGAITGTFMVFLIAKNIEKYSRGLSNVFISIGKETYVIVAFSQIIIMLLNEYYQLNVVLKYVLLVVVLTMIKFTKDVVNSVFHIKIL